MATGAPSAQTLAANVRFRRNAANLTAGQLRALRNAFLAVYAIHDDRGYERWAGIHGLPLPDPRRGDLLAVPGKGGYKLSTPSH